MMIFLKSLISTIFSILYTLLLQKHIQSHIPNNYKVINKNKMSYNTLCPCFSSTWEQYFKILHNMHFDHVIWHHNTFCNIFVWLMSVRVCCDIIRLIWTWQQQNFNLMCFALNKTCISHHLLALFLFHRQYQPKKPHMVCGCLIFARISVQMHRYPLEDIFIYSCWLQIVQYTPTYLFSYILQVLS